MRNNSLCPECNSKPIEGHQLDSIVDGFGHAYAGEHLVCSCGKGWDFWQHDRLRCSSPHGKPHVPRNTDNQMSEAIRNQMQHVETSMRVDRSGWSDDQWIDDARELVDDIEGSVLDLLNGHIVAMLRKLDTYE